MLGNIIGGFIVILVGRDLISCPLEMEVSNAEPEFRLKSLRGQDRSVNIVNSIYARTTDKGFQNGRIYSLDLGYKMKPKINTLIAAQGLTTQSHQGEIFDSTAEFRLKSLRGQDRSVKHLNYARETDKAYFTFFNENESKIYSPNSDYKMKSEINNRSQKCVMRDLCNYVVVT